MNALDLSLPARSAAGDLVDAALRAGKTIRLAVSTQSMRPTLAPGDQVTARAVEPRVGAIALIRSNSHWLTHRLVARRRVKDQIFWVTKGDNCTAPDDLWSTGQICAIIIAVERNGRRVDLQSRRAIAAGGCLAMISRLQAQAAAAPRGIQFVAGAIVRLGALAVQRVVGLG